MLIGITPDKEKAKSIVKMVETTLQMISETNYKKYPSNVTKEYYEVIRESISIILLLDGYKTLGKGAHKELITYLTKNYPEFTQQELSLIEELRRLRNKISYDGFFIDEDYIERNKDYFLEIIKKLKKTIKTKL
jgi:hypothetical protein